jgi:hypothetical protein
MALRRCGIRYECRIDEEINQVEWHLCMATISASYYNFSLPFSKISWFAKGKKEKKKF